jgi:hypothetical protein
MSVISLAFVLAGCGKTLPPLRVIPEAPKQAPMARPPAEMMNKTCVFLAPELCKPEKSN